MAEEKAKRARRTVEDRIAEIDAKIAALEAKKQELLRPAKMKKIIEEAFRQHDSRRNGRKTWH